MRHQWRRELPTAFTRQQTHCDDTWRSWDLSPNHKPTVESTFILFFQLWIMKNVCHKFPELKVTSSRLILSNQQRRSACCDIKRKNVAIPHSVRNWNQRMSSIFTFKIQDIYCHMHNNYRKQSLAVKFLNPRPLQISSTSPQQRPLAPPGGSRCIPKWAEIYNP